MSSPATDEVKIAEVPSQHPVFAGYYVQDDKCSPSKTTAESTDSSQAVDNPAERIRMLMTSMGLTRSQDQILFHDACMRAVAIGNGQAQSQAVDKPMQFVFEDVPNLVVDIPSSQPRSPNGARPNIFRVMLSHQQAPLMVVAMEKPRM